METDLLAALRDARDCICCRWRPTEGARFQGIGAVREWIEAELGTLTAALDSGSGDDAVDKSADTSPTSPDSTAADTTAEAADHLVSTLLALKRVDDALSVARSYAATRRRAVPLAKGHSGLLLGRALAASADRAEAVPVLLMALADFTEHDDRPLTARTAMELARVLLALGAVESALTHVDEAVEVFQLIGDPLNEGHATALRARILKAYGSAAESADAGRDAAERFAELEAPLCEANALLHAGVTLLNDLRAPEEAAEVFLPCAQRCADLGDRRGEARALRLLGAAHHLEGDGERAAAALRRAADAAKAAGDATELASSRRHLASVLNAAGRHRDAAVLARSAADHFAVTGRPHAEGSALTILALAQAGTGHTPSAISTAQRAVALLLRADARSDAAAAYAVLGTLSLDLHRYTGGVSALREALRLFLEEGDVGHAMQVRQSLAEAEAARQERGARPVSWR